jgi:hypothetical protein
MMVLIESPRVPKAVPSLRDLTSIEDAQWHKMTVLEVALGRLKWKLKNKLLLAFDKQANSNQ